MNICASKNIDTKYKSGLILERTIEYHVRLDLNEHFGDLNLAEELIRSHPYFLNSEDLTIRYDSTNSEGQMLFIVDATFVDDSKKLINPMWEATSTFEETETIFDYENNLIKVNYLPPGGGPQDLMEQVVPVTAARPRVELRVRTLDDYFPLVAQIPPEMSPVLYVMNLWLNKINSLPWRGMNTHTVLCTSVNITPFYINRERLQLIYESEFVFIFDPFGHHKWVYFKDIDGNVPTDVYWNGNDYSNGIKLVQIFAETDFNLLPPLAGKDI